MNFLAVPDTAASVQTPIKSLLDRHTLNIFRVILDDWFAISAVNTKEQLNSPIA